MEDGSYMRMKNLIFGYTFPESMLRGTGLDKLRVYLQAANLFTITKYTGLDPELPGSNTASTNFGTDGGVYPANQKTFSFGINLGF